MLNETFKVLIVDDNTEVQDDFCKILVTNQSRKNSDLRASLFDEEEIPSSTSPKIEVYKASQGQEALELVKAEKENNSSFALAFIDVRMPPGWDGIETIEQIWKVDPHLQTVICTAYSDTSWDEVNRRLPKSHQLLILKKPFDPIEVRQLTAALTQKWAINRELEKHINQLEDLVKERTSIIKATLESTQEVILVTNQLGEIIEHNQKVYDLWKLPALNTILKGQHITDTMLVDAMQEPDDFIRHVDAAQNEPEKIISFELALRCKQFLECYAHSIYIDGVCTGRVWSFRDITLRRQMEIELVLQATHDKLTGIANRALLMDRIVQACKNTKEKNQNLFVLFLDLDGFKLINDNLGHDAGDMVLKTISERLQLFLSCDHTVARMGGDEFVLLILNITVEQLKDKVTAILDDIKKPIKFNNQELSITGSIGIYQWDKLELETEKLLKNADVAMYYAKRNGKNKFCFYEEALQNNYICTMTVETSITKAIANDELEIRYIPLFDLQTNKLIKLKASIEWLHPKLGLINLSDPLLPVQDSIHLELDQWSIKKITQQINGWKHELNNLVPVTYKISLQLFWSDELPRILTDITTSNAGSFSHLCLDIPDAILQSESKEKIKQQIQLIKAHGLSVSIDDLGKSISNLHKAHELPIDGFTITSSLLKNKPINENDQQLISVAKALNMQLIADDINTEDELNYLLSNYANMVHGYYFSKALSEKECRTLMK